MALNKLQALKLIQFLNQSIKNPETSLKYRNQFTLLTSVVLSAQEVTKPKVTEQAPPQKIKSGNDLKSKRIRHDLRSQNLYRQTTQHGRSGKTLRRKV